MSGKNTDISEVVAQKREILLRVIFQNLALVLSILTFSLISLISLYSMQNSWLFASINTVVSGAFILQWCHHGVRIMQLKKYIVQREKDIRDTWEIWLPLHRPDRILGTNWLISTKGVFLGLQAVSIILAYQISNARIGWELFFCLVGFVISSVLLFTNPKE